MKKLGIALITPFDKYNNIDYKSIKKLYNHIKSYKIDYILLFGSTGEIFSLTDIEKIDILNYFNLINKDKIKTIINIHGNNVNKIIYNVNYMKLNKKSKIIMLTVPYYICPTQNGIYEYFNKIAKNLNCKIILYNNPKRTGINMSSNTIIKLSINNTNIVGIKESSGSLLQIHNILKNISNKFLVLSGEEYMNLPIMVAGGNGIISVLAQALISDYVNIIKYINLNDINKAYKKYYNIFDIMKILYKLGNPIGIKILLNIMGICNNYTRLPLITIDNNLVSELKNKYILYYNNNN